MTDPEEVHTETAQPDGAQAATDAQDTAQATPASADVAAAVASTADPNPSPAPETSANGAGSEGASNTDANAESGNASAASGGPSSENAETVPGTTAAVKKKRRRRRRKKKGAAAADGSAPEGGADASPKGAKGKGKESPPLSKYFESSSYGRRGPFNVGEEVAGRVLEVHEGSFVVDLFGRGTASVDVVEPHEVPDMPEPPPTVKVAEVTAVGDVAAESAGDAAALDQSSPTATAPYGVSVEAVEKAILAEEAAGPPSTLLKVEDTKETLHGFALSPEQLQMAAEQAKADANAATQPSVEAPATEASPSESAAAEPVSAAPASADDDVEDPGQTAEEELTGIKPVHLETSPGDPQVTVEPLIDEGPLHQEPEPTPAPQVGSVFRGRVGRIAESGHMALINRVIDARASRRSLAHARDERNRVNGLVYGYNRGGFDVLVHGIRAFCPASAISLEFVEDPRPFLGHRFEFLVQPARGSKRTIVVSRKSILEREQRKAARDRFKEIKKGDIIDGRVTQIRDYGILVNIGIIEGMVHQSEASWVRGAKLSSVAKVGEEVKVKVLDVTPPNRKERFGRVALSIRALQADPWEEQSAGIKPGHHCEGTVVQTTEFGAFVQLAPGVDGLLHITELGRELKHAKQAVKSGDKIHVVVERIDKKSRKISLSKLSPEEVKAIAAGTFDVSTRPKSLTSGSIVKVIIERSDRNGLSVRVPGVLGRRGKGFIRSRELGEVQGDRAKAYAAGMEIEVKITGTDRDGGLRCSVKAREQDEERKAVRAYRKEASKRGFGTFGDLLKSKLDD